jgi:hypothetical protein
MSVPLKATSGRRRRTSLALDHITIDERLKSRELKPAVVKDYAAVMRRGGVFPPVLVVRDGKDKYYLVDGHHRVTAARKLNGVDTIDTDIIDGTFTDALWLSWGANREHGLRRTQKEKRRAIHAALLHPKWSKESDRAIGRHIGCDHKTVGATRHHLKRRQRASGEFPTGRTHAGPSARNGPSKSAILQACQLLAQARPEQASQFDAVELGIVRAGYEPLHRLLFGTKPQPRHRGR